MKILNSRYFDLQNCFKNETTPKRRVECFELELIHFGTGCSCIGKEVHRHTKNLMLFRKPGQDSFTIGNFKCTLIWFEVEDAELYVELCQMPSFAVVSNDTANKFLHLQASIEGQGALKTASELFSVLCEFENSSSQAGRTARPVYIDNVLRVKKYIDSNFTRDINTTDLSKISNLSPSFTRLQFTNILGVSPHEYLVNLRLETAKGLVMTTNKTLLDIACESGFNSQSNMNFAFKKRFGASPLKYKKTHGDSAVLLRTLHN